MVSPFKFRRWRNSIRSVHRISIEFYATLCPFTPTLPTARLPAGRLALPLDGVSGAGEYQELMRLYQLAIQAFNYHKKTSI
jgi:hypothetical protein